MSKIAFRPEEAVSNRQEMRREKKVKLVKLVCPNCGYTIYGEKIAVIVKNKNPVTGKLMTMRVHRECPECGTNLVRRIAK